MVMQRKATGCCNVGCCNGSVRLIHDATEKKKKQIQVRLLLASAEAATNWHEVGTPRADDTPREPSRKAHQTSSFQFLPVIAVDY